MRGLMILLRESSVLAWQACSPVGMFAVVRATRTGRQTTTDEDSMCVFCHTRHFIKDFSLRKKFKIWRAASNGRFKISNRVQDHR